MPPIPAALRVALHDLLSPEKIAGVVEGILLLLLIAVVAWAILRISLSLVRQAGARAPGRSGSTVTPILEGLVRYTIGITALVLMLEALHVNVTAIAASAGIAGVALGFGAQYLIRDILAGFFLLSEGAVKIGDLVRVDGEVGWIERISLRVTQIRKYSGELLTIQNGTIGRLGNLSRDFGRAIVQVTVPYKADVGEALKVFREAARAWAAENPQEVKGEPGLDGVVDLKDIGIVLQLSVLVPPGSQSLVEPQLRQRALEALAARGIVIEPGLLRY
jgi:moderate conductance mechanosensitive channel